MKNQDLMPPTLDEFIGQTQAKRVLRILINAAKKRCEPICHLLFASGWPGVGKTTLARIIASEVGGANLVEVLGCAIKEPGEMARIVQRLRQNDVLFIDECHALPRAVEEVLYAPMTEGILLVEDNDYGDLMKQLGVASFPPQRQQKWIALPPFTLVGATTTQGELSGPLKSRFAHCITLTEYSVDELTEIIMRAADKLEFRLPKSIARAIAGRSRGTARTAVNYLLWFRDVVTGSNSKANRESLALAFDMKGIDQHGLTDTDRSYLTHLHTDGTVGLNTLAVALNETQATITADIEPYLIQQGLVRKTGRGRGLTAKGMKLLEEA